MLNKLYVLSLVFIVAFAGFSIHAQAADMGVPIQLKLRAPDLSYPTQTGISIKVYILSNTGCILREEDFSNRDITEGNLTLMLGSGIPNSLPAGGDPGLSLNAVYNNSVAKTGLTCINSSNVVVGTGQTYTPAANDGRVLRIVTNDLASPITANFNMKSAPYAVQAESVGGKDGADILTRNTGTQLSQANLEALLGDATKLSNLMNIANSGQAISAATATNATNATNATSAQNSVSFTGSLAGDVTGVQSATVVSKLRGVNLSATAPTVGQVLTYDGAQYIPTTPAAATVASVNGQTGVVVLNASHIAGVVTSASALLGDVTGNVSATVVSSVGGKSAAAIATVVNDVNSATANSTAGMLVRRDGSGNISASTMSATNNSTRNIYLYEATNTSYVRLAAPAAVSNYTLTFPVNAGTAGQMLQTDGSGNLSWVAGGGVTSAAIVSALGYTPANNASLTNYPLKANNLSDLGNVATARTNLGLGGAAVLNVGTTAGTVAAGDDSRITGALQQSAFNAAIASAACTTGETMYWNSVSSEFLCQSIVLSSAQVQAAISTPTCSAGQYLTYNGTSYLCVADSVGGAATSGAIISALGYTPADNAALSNYPLKANNLSDLGNVVTARSNLGLGAAAVLNIGTTAGTVAAGDDSRITGAVQASAFPTCAAGEYLTFNGTVYSCATDSTGPALTAGAINTALGYTAADAADILAVGTTAGTVAAGNDSRITGAVQASAIPTCSAGQYLTFNGTVYSCAVDTTGAAATSGAIISALGYTPADNTALVNYPTKANNLSDLASATVARTNLGLGAAAVLNIGTTAGTLAAGNDSRITGAVQSSALPTCSAGQYLTFNGTVWSCAADVVGGAATSGAIISALGFTPADNAALSNYPLKSNNLSDLGNVVTARSNLGLGGFATVSSLDLGSASATGTLAAARLPAFTGDATTVAGNSAITLANSGVNAGTYAMVTVDAKGRVTSGNALTGADVIAALGFTPGNNAVAGDYAQKANNLSDLTNVVTARSNLGLGGFATVSSLDLGSASATGTLAAARLPAFTGDATTVAGNSAITLANSGVAAGSYYKVTVDAKGRVTSGNALVASDITTALTFTPINRSLASTNFYVGNGSSIATAVAMSGDATMANTGAVTLKNTGTAGTYGTSSTATTFTTDAQGRVTAVSENAIAIASSRVTDFAVAVIGTVLPGLTLTNSAVTSADSILIAIGKLQAQLNTRLSPATTKVSATGNITTASATDALMTGMTITPPAGTYQVMFTTSVSHGSNGGVISMSIYSGGVEATDSITQTTPRVAAGISNAALTLNQTVIGEVTVNGAQSIEIHWNSSTGTATSVGTRTMMINRVR